METKPNRTSVIRKSPAKKGSPTGSANNSFMEKKASVPLVNPPSSFPKIKSEAFGSDYGEVNKFPALKKSSKELAHIRLKSIYLSKISRTIKPKHAVMKSISPSKAKSLLPRIPQQNRPKGSVSIRALSGSKYSKPNRMQGANSTNELKLEPVSSDELKKVFDKYRLMTVQSKALKINASYI